MNRPINLFWSESSHYFGANSPVRNFERNVPEEKSREELVLERTVPEPQKGVVSFVHPGKKCLVSFGSGVFCLAPEVGKCHSINIFTAAKICIILQRRVIIIVFLPNLITG